MKTIKRLLPIYLFRVGEILEVALFLAVPLFVIWVCKMSIQYHR